MAADPARTSSTFGLAVEAQLGTGVRVADTDRRARDRADREVCRTIEDKGCGAAYQAASRFP